MENKELKPKIRFKGYDCSADDIKFSEIIDKKIDNRGFTPNFYIKGKHPLIEVAAVGERKPNYKNVVKYLDDNAFDNQLREYIQENDILYSTVGSVGEVTLMDDNKMAAIAQNIVGFRCKANFDSKYIYSLLSTEKSRRIANSIVMSAVQPSIKIPQLLNCKLIVTSDLNEQVLIGKFFENIDNLINSKKRELDKWKGIKASFLSKMFPKPGSRVPELRFKGFSREWEYTKIEGIATFLHGNGISWNDVNNNGKYECILYGNLYTDYGMIIEDEINYRTNRVLTRPVFSQKGDVLIPSSDTTPTGLARATSIEKEGVILGGGINIIRPIDGVNGSYLSLLINCYKKELIKLIKGTTVRHIYNDDIKLIQLPITKNLKEQIAIVKLFKIIDKNINLQQQKLEKLKQIKQSFLSKMFV